MLTPKSSEKVTEAELKEYQVVPISDPYLANIPIVESKKVTSHPQA